MTVRGKDLLFTILSFVFIIVLFGMLFGPFCEVGWTRTNILGQEERYYINVSYIDWNIWPGDKQVHYENENDLSSVLGLSESTVKERLGTLNIKDDILRVDFLSNERLLLTYAPFMLLIIVGFVVILTWNVRSKKNEEQKKILNENSTDNVSSPDKNGRKVVVSYEDGLAGLMWIIATVSVSILINWILAFILSSEWVNHEYTMTPSIWAGVFFGSALIIIFLMIGLHKSICKDMKAQNLTSKEMIKSMPYFTSSTATKRTVDTGAEEILKYKELLDNGIITQEEFDKKKNEILNR